MIIGQKATVTIRRYGLLSHGDRVLVALSGGPDSVALLHILRELGAEFRLELEVAHLQHGVRGEEAREDARFAAQLAQILNVPFHLKEINLPEMRADAGKGNIEALGRAERYRFFTEVARDRKIQKIATAHTLDDQAETVSMWFLRGAGSKGLAGMAPLQQVVTDGDSLTVIRPLLEVSKAEILEYLQKRQFDFRLDRTNQDTALLRNWLRLDLLPKNSTDDSTRECQRAWPSKRKFFAMRTLSWTAWREQVTAQCSMRHLSTVRRCSIRRKPCSEEYCAFGSSKSAVTCAGLSSFTSRTCCV